MSNLRVFFSPSFFLVLRFVLFFTRGRGRAAETLTLNRLQGAAGTGWKVQGRMEVRGVLLGGETAQISPAAPCGRPPPEGQLIGQGREVKGWEGREGLCQRETLLF